MDKVAPADDRGHDCLMMVAGAGGASGALRQSLRRRGTSAARSRQGDVRHRRRSRRPPAARLHDDGRQVAPAARPEATSIRTTSKCSSPSRTSASTATTASMRRPFVRAVRADGAPRPSRLRRLDADDAGRAPARRQARAHARRQAAPDGPRHRARAGALEDRDPEALSSLGAVRRQSRRRPSRVARLLRQGAAPPLARRMRHSSSRCRNRRKSAVSIATREAARRARDRVLNRAVAAHVITAAEAERAKAERIPTVRYAFPMLAPHLAETEVADHPTEQRHQADARHATCRQASKSSRPSRRALLGDKVSTAVVVADHQTGEILAQVGSAGYMDAGRQGAVDMATAVRSPGSTLKPFIYGLAFEAGLAHPETLIDDRPVRFGTYQPKNFDESLSRHRFDPRSARLNRSTFRPSACSLASDPASSSAASAAPASRHAFPTSPNRRSRWRSAAPA